ncbi:MAG: carbohydrate ABC transporter permease [Clostridia bacterium]|nr:carbohydrate ABC transporter permease [Clostridia bacterium]MBR4442170.1 carbohydrate ABC transporter permease [Clostridia bacterium]
MKKRKLSVGRALIQLFLILWLVACVFPLYWLFSFSLKDNSEIFGGNVVGLPGNWIWSNYSTAWGAGKISLYLRNSVITTGATLLLTLLLSFMASYGLLRMRWKGQKVTMTYLMLGLMIPMHAALKPLLGILMDLKVLSTHMGLIIPYTAFNIPMAILIISGFVGSIPFEMEEAACIDGSGVYRTAFTIILPMLIPALVTAAIFVFLQVWNEMLMASVFVSTDNVRTLTVGIQQMFGQYQTDWGPIGAALVISTIPTLVLYLCMSGQVQRSLIAGAVKG